MTDPEIMARMADEARKAVLVEMRPIEDLAAIAGRTAAEMQCDLHRWKVEGRIFSVEHHGAELFPAFALDPNSQYSPYPVVNLVLRILGDVFDRGNAWALASWFIGVNSYLDDQRPQDLLASDPEWVIDAARDEVETGKFPHG